MVRTRAGLEIELVDDVEAALRRVGAVLAFHALIQKSTRTAEVVARARARGLTVEVVSGTELPTGRVLCRKKEAAR